MEGCVGVLVSSLVLLHSPSGREVRINPQAVVTMHAAIPGVENQHITSKAKCAIHTSDGKFTAVIETCEMVCEAFLKPQ